MEPTVVFLHGLARTQRSLVGLRRRVEAAGFPTWAVTYPSRRLPLPDLVDWVAARIEADLRGVDLAAVTHSMGGILVRHLAERLPWRGVVMLAPPNRGSAVARALRELRLFRLTHGPNGPLMASPEAWPAPPAPFGVIAGTRGPSLDNPTSWLVHALRLLPPDGPHDGLVTVEETRLPEMADFATLPASHTWIMDHPETSGLVLRFLRSGSFAP